jgi:hypothetical protein
VNCTNKKLVLFDIFVVENQSVKSVVEKIILVPQELVDKKHIAV